MGRPGRAVRPGSVSPALVIALSILGAFGATAYFIVPAGPAGAVAAGTLPHEVRAARVDRNQEVIDGLAALLAASAEIIAIHQRDDDAGPYVEVLFRTREGEPGQAAAAEELALISHSEILQTVTLYTIDESDAGAALQQSELWGWPEPETRDFADRWRSEPGVRGRVIATGISDMRLTRAEQADPSLLRLWISLTWSRESVDGGDEAAAVVEARRFLDAER